MNPLAQYLLDACAETVLAVDPETLAIISANRQAETLLGYSEDDLIGRPIADIEAGLQDMFFWEEVRHGNQSECMATEGEYRHHAGHLITVQKTVRLLDIEGSRFFVVSLHDITRLKQLEVETARTNLLLAATLESTVDGILVTSIGGVVQYFNRRFADMLRLSGQVNDARDNPQLLEHLNRQLEQPSEFQQWFDKLLDKPAAEGSIECQLHDGRILAIASRPQRLRDSTNGRVFSFHDITAFKNSEAALITARDAAQAADRAKSDFLSHMSHELRTPLNAILGFSQMLEHELTQPQRNLASNITKAGLHLLDLINEVLDLASIEAGKIRLEMRQIDLADVIRHCVDLVAPLAASRNIELHVKPLMPGRFVVNGDARRLRQMTFNLLSNAIKYNREQGRVDISVTAQGDDHWRLTVSDTGSDIPEQEQTQLFEPFQRIGQASTENEGAGIGLTITRKLAHMMNGRVGMESRPGIGSSFWIDLPCTAALPAAESVANVHPATEHGPTVLYIEDDILSQKMLASILQRMRPHYRLLLAGNAAQGLALASKEPVDLVLLDLQLPDRDGASVLQALRAQALTRETPVIALTGNTRLEQIASNAAGYSAYLTKPLQIDTALTCIDSALRQHHA